MFAEAAGGDLNGIYLAARTSTAGTAGGRYTVAFASTVIVSVCAPVVVPSTVPWNAIVLPAGYQLTACNVPSHQSCNHWPS